MTLSERIRNLTRNERKRWLAAVNSNSMDLFCDILDCLAEEIEGQVLVTPVTVELEPDVWVTRFPNVEVHGSSPEESLASFVERVEEVERGQRS